MTAQGYDLYAPASSQLVAHDRGIWESFDQTVTDVNEQAVGKIGAVPLIMVGRSQGAVRAAQSASSLDSAIGAILVALAPKPETCPNLDTPTYIIGGQKDRVEFIDAMRSFTAYQESRGVPLRFDLLPNMGHRYPDDFSSRIQTAVEWIQENQ